MIATTAHTKTTTTTINNNNNNNNNRDTSSSYHLNPLTMIGRQQKQQQHSNTNNNNTNTSSSSSNCSFWSKHHHPSHNNNHLTYNHLHMFWCDLTPQARQNLLRIDKQTLFEHARKNMYCSRCNGLLLEGYLQIVMYGKSLQQDAAAGGHATHNQTHADVCTSKGCRDDAQDPSVHPWGGLTTVRDGTLTILDCYIYSKSFKGLQNVFDSARARERERELLYPDACGVGGRGWISQGVSGYGRGHGTREACALHTARLSVETLVDFWSALGDETQQSLLRMKEEDFVERLMYRFENKRFCRDCRRNVIREFKELKELKRVRKETQCTSWFCVADTAFRCEVSHDAVQADWYHLFSDAVGTYHHFEWAIGTGEGKCDIMEFEDVGLSLRVHVNGLDLSGLNACYVTLRAWRMNGCCNELCVKAHALRGQQCVHCRVVVGDGFVTITRGESITRFFEHAEEAEEEEDDDSMDKDGNELDDECSPRPQKHAKSPELAREFLLDAATVIFKEQVEKAFREGTARQNAHSIFVCLALKLLEERVHVACKEIITLEKQMKLLEEEEKEKREEEDRKERRRTKEREKKLRRKGRLREKENREKKYTESNTELGDLKEESTPCIDEGINVVSNRDSVAETGEATPPSSPLSPDTQDDQLLTEDIFSTMQNHSDNVDEEIGNPRDGDASYPYDHQITLSRRNQKFRNDSQRNFIWSDRRKGSALSDNGIKHEQRHQADGFESTRSSNSFNKQLRTNTGKPNIRNGGTKLNMCTKNNTVDKYDSHACTCNHHNEYRSKPDSNIPRAVAREPKYVHKLEYPSDISKPYYRGKYTKVDCARESNGRPKSKIIVGNPFNMKKVWEPLDSQKKYVRSNSDSDVTLRSRTKVESGSTSCDEVTDISVKTNHEDYDTKELTTTRYENCENGDNGLHVMAKSEKYSKDEVVEDVELCSMTKSPKGTSTDLCFKSSSSNSDNCSSCVSEGDSNSNSQNAESTSTSDSEDSSQNSEGREIKNGFTECHEVEDNQSTSRVQDTKNEGPASAGGNISVSRLSKEAAPFIENGRGNINVRAMSENVLPQMHNQNIHYPVFPSPTMGYYHQSPVSWPAGPTNGLMSFPNSNHYLFANSYGYGLNGNARFMQYGPVQHLAPPVRSHGHLPIFQPVSRVNGVSTKKPTKVANIAGLKEEQDIMQKVVLTDQESQTVVNDGQNGKSVKMDKVNNDFSLFHFGGPAALSTGGFKADSTGFHPCNNKDTIEEYNLFAASNGIKFSIF